MYIFGETASPEKKKKSQRIPSGLEKQGSPCIWSGRTRQNV